jgi:FlaA1/EpsC-like NDP-sugar epimerase
MKLPERRHKMKLSILILMLLLISPIMAVQNVPISCIAEVKIDRQNENETNLIIIGEDHDQYLNPNSFVFRIKNNHSINSVTNLSEGIYVTNTNGETLPRSGTEIKIHISRELGNQSELYEIIDTCNNMANFSYKWEVCMETKNNVELQMVNQMINKTIAEQIETNLTRKIDTLEDSKRNMQTQKDIEIKDLKERIEELETHRQFGWGIGFVGLALSLYLGNKYTNFGKRKHQEQNELPKDVSS